MNRLDALTPALLDLRQHLHTRRAARVKRLSLERELATYSSPRDLDEWDAILARYDDSDADAAQIRDILTRTHTRAA